MSRFKSLKEAVFGIPKTPASIEPVKKTSIVIGSIEQSSGKSPDVSFASQVKTLNSDPVIKENISEFAQEVCSTGIFTTMNSTYSVKLLGKTAKEIIDEWNTKNDLDNKILQISVELTAFGNSFWYINDGGFMNIPIEAIQKAVSRSKTISLREEYNLELVGSYQGKPIEWGQFVHFKTGVTGMSCLGSGIILGLIASPDGSSEEPSLWEIRKAYRKSMLEGFKKFSFENELWVFEGMSNEDFVAEGIGEKISKMKATGNRIATNARGEIKLAVPQRTQGYDAWLAQVEREFYSSLGGGLTPNSEFTTKATAEATRAAYMMRIASSRRVIKRIIESLWAKVLTKSGFDPALANVKLNFGAEELDITVEALTKLVEDEVISKEELRRHLIKRAKIELDGENPPKQEGDKPDV